MNRINPIRTDNNIIKIKEIQNKEFKPKNISFKEKIGIIKSEEIRDELKNLYGKIEEQSTKLQKSLFIDDLIQYKKLVKKFLNISVNNSHVFYRENSLDRRGRHRIYSMVKKVDVELDELTKEFTHLEDNRLRILKRLDDIKGLLIDILA